MRNPQFEQPGRHRPEDRAGPGTPAPSSRRRLHAADAGGAPAIFSEDHFAAANRRLWARRGFYRRAFEDDSQNSIARYLQEFDVEENERAVKPHYGITKLSGVQAFAARHYSYGNIGCTVEWLQGKIEATPEQMAAYEQACMPAFLRESYADLYR